MRAGILTEDSPMAVLLLEEVIAAGSVCCLIVFATAVATFRVKNEKNKGINPWFHEFIPLFF